MTKPKILILFLLLLVTSAAFSQKKDKKKGKETEVIQKASAEDILNAERFFFDGQKEKILGNIQEAYTFFNEATKLHPGLDAAFFEIAQIQQMAGDLVSAQKSLQKAILISPKNIWYQQYNGDLYASQYQYDKAALVYQTLKKDNPKVYDYYFQEAYYLILSNQMKEALAVYNEIEEAIGIQPDASLQKHKIYARDNQPDLAAKELEKLINAYPDELEFQNNLADFYLSNGETEKAIGVFEKILATDSNNIMALTSLADYYKKNNQPEKALIYSKKAFSNPDIPVDAKITVLFNYIQFYEKNKGEINEAFELSNILIATHPKEAKAYAIAGDLRNLDDKPREALNFYYQSLELRKDVFTVWQQVFFINSDLKDYDALTHHTELAKEYFPNNALVYFFNGLAYQQKDDFWAAEKSYTRAVKMANSNPELLAQLYSNLGDTYNSLKKYPESDENFEKALGLNAKNAYVLNNYSYYLSLRAENLEKAAEMSLLSNELVPNNSSFLDTYAWILYKSQKYKEAKEWQEKAIKASDEVSATLLEHLGDIMFQLGDKQNALIQWKEAAKLKGGSDFLQKKIQDEKLYE